MTMPFEFHKSPWEAQEWIVQKCLTNQIGKYDSLASLAFNILYDDSIGRIKFDHEISLKELDKKLLALN